MYSNQDIKREVDSILERVVSAGTKASSAWITTEVCNHHPLPDDWDGDDREFWMLCGISGAQKKVREYLNSLQAEEVKTDQPHLPGIVMPGFKRLQKSYFVSDLSSQDPTPVLTPLTEMTDEQITLKVNELRKNAAGLEEHARELLRYMDDRRRVA